MNKVFEFLARVAIRGHFAIVLGIVIELITVPLMSPIAARVPFVHTLLHGGGVDGEVARFIFFHLLAWIPAMGMGKYIFSDEVVEDSGVRYVIRDEVGRKVRSGSISFE